MSLSGFVLILICIPRLQHILLEYIRIIVGSQVLVPGYRDEGDLDPLKWGLEGQKFAFITIPWDEIFRIRYNSYMYS